MLKMGNIKIMLILRKCGNLMIGIKEMFE